MSKHSGIHGVRPTTGGIPSDSSRARTCQWTDGCKKDVVLNSYCEEHYRRCYQVGSAPRDAKKTAAYRLVGKLGWGTGKG
jgi:hypothetical protein